MVEPAQVDIIEINCSVLGDVSEARASVCERPISEGLLTYEDKYLRGSKGQGMQAARREIPADISPELTRAIQTTAVQAFQAIGASGVARIDFLVHHDDARCYVNEINTMPGSLSFYLWEPAGVTFEQLLDTLITLARTRQREKRRTTYTFSTWLLQRNPLIGSKAAGGSKLSEFPRSDNVQAKQSTSQQPTALLKQES
jgi:D-alanine-D-alanine ligase